MVGGNGSGKTNFLSLITDALFEAAAAHYDDVLPSKGAGRAWFRTVGGTNISVGASGSFSMLRFDDGGTDRIYKEKAGTVDPIISAPRLQSSLQAHMNWTTEGSIKEFNIDDDRSRTLFDEGIYTYFPSSRSEQPYWLNQGALPKIEFQVSPLFAKRLPRPIIVENGLSLFKQWLISVIADTRTELFPSVVSGSTQWQISGDPTGAISSSTALEACNRLLKSVLGEPTARFFWMGRKSPEKVAVVVNGFIALPNLDSFSTGQALLLGMFGTLLRYGDLAVSGSSMDPNGFTGICVIDEIDAHTHNDVQHKILPSLIKLFPSVQFIITSHSPIFVLGMERDFGADGIQVISMPNGTPVGSETYSDFTAALEALSASHAFTQCVVTEAQNQQRPVVYVEGETDAPYLRRAAEILNRHSILALCDIEWIGSRDPGGQAFHTGKDALKLTLSVFKAKPDLVIRPILLLNDNDSKSPDQNYGNIFMRTLPVNKQNTKVLSGIENLLSEGAISEEFYQVKVTRKDNGDTNTNRTIRKMDLCNYLCLNGTADQFAFFANALDIIEQCLSPR